MSKIPAYLPLVVRWKPVGASRAQALTNAYCVISVANPQTAALLKRKVGEGCIVTSGAGCELRILARTDSRGVLMTLPVDAKGPLDPLSPSAVSPLMCPLGISARLWWTHNRESLDAVMRDEGTREARLKRASSLSLAFDDTSELLPQAIEVLLLELQNGAELRELLRRPREEAFPTEILRLADDGRTWCVELHDHALELAVDSALRMQQLGSLKNEHNFPAHQLLIDQVIDILQRRGRESDGSQPISDTIPRHERLGGFEYRGLREELASVIRRCPEKIDEAGKVLLAVYDAAFDELSLHPYPEGDFEERGSGPVSQRWTAKLLVNAGAFALRNPLAETFYHVSDEGLEARLLSIASGEGDPAEASHAEQFMAHTTAVVAWLSKASGFVQRGTNLAASVSDPAIVEPVTEWLNTLPISAGRLRQAGTNALVGAVTRSMRLAQTWTGLEPNFEVELAKRRVLLQGAPTELRLEIAEADAQRWVARFERAGRLLKLLNVLSLGDSMLKPDGQRPSILMQMIQLHGFVEGLEGTYRILTDTAETQLGTQLRSLGKLMGPVGIYVGLEDTWAKLHASNSLGAQLAMSSVMVGVLTLALDAVATAPHPAVKAALAAAGLVLAVWSEYTMEEEEKLLEGYRPRCENAGAYLEASNAVSLLQKALEEADEETRKAAERASQLGL